MSTPKNMDRQFVELVVSMVVATIERHRPRELLEVGQVIDWLDRALAADQTGQRPS